MKLGRAFLEWKWIYFPITKNKSFEYQLELGSKFADQPFELNIRWSSKGDHAGFNFRFSIYKLFWIEFNLCDNRHWNYEENRWWNHGEIESILKEKSQI